LCRSGVCPGTHTKYLTKVNLPLRGTRYSAFMSKWGRRKRFITRRGLIYSLVLCLLIMGLGGAGFWLLEPRALTYSDGLWLAFTTAATVGYGDIVPSTHGSRAFAVVVVMLGLAVLSLVTASVAAIFVEAEERQVERDLMREILAIRADVRRLHDEVSRLQSANRPPP
jgi:voltage-gated potassium channel